MRAPSAWTTVEETQFLWCSERESFMTSSAIDHLERVLLD
jgi:hypothetical protein